MKPDQLAVDAEALLSERGALLRFATAYARQRLLEGRAASIEEMISLPYMFNGPLRKHWQVRARTFDVFVRRVVVPAERGAFQPLRVLDLGAGNGWLCYRLAMRGHTTVAADIRTDLVDGLACAAELSSSTGCSMKPVAASFDALPFAPGQFDLVVFNAAVHYAIQLEIVMSEAERVLASKGRVAILDSPFYTQEEYGAAMVAEKHAGAYARFGDLAADLMSLPFIEYLTPSSLAKASGPAGLSWRRHRVRYPVWYELRPLTRKLRARRPPSRFDVWEGRRDLTPRRIESLTARDMRALSNDNSSSAHMNVQSKASSTM